VKPARLFWLVLLVFWGYIGVYAWTHDHATHVARKPLPAGVVTTCPTGSYTFVWLKLPNGDRVLCGNPPPNNVGTWGQNLPEPGDVPVTSPSGSRPAPKPGTCPADYCQPNNPNPLPPNQRPKA